MGVWMVAYLLLKEGEVLQDHFFLFFKGFGIRVLYVVVLEKFFDHDDKVVSEVDPFVVDLSGGGDVADDLNLMWATVLSSLRSSFSLGLISRLKEASFPPFSMMLISSLTILLSSCNFWLYWSVIYILYTCGRHKSSRFFNFSFFIELHLLLSMHSRALFLHLIQDHIP